MSEALLLLILRGIAGLCLLGFLGAVAYFLQRDLALAARQSQFQKQARGRLVVVANESAKPTQGTELPLMAATTLGRAPGNTIQIDDAFASNQHARVVQRLGQWWLEDQRSSNGTHVNGMPVEEPVVLTSGDIIEIGSVQLRLELD